MKLRLSTPLEYALTGRRFFLDAEQLSGTGRFGAHRPPHAGPPGGGGGSTASDVSPPLSLVFNPVDNSTSAGEDQLCTITFNEPVVVGTGTWTLRTGGISTETMTELDYVPGGSPGADEWSISADGLQVILNWGPGEIFSLDDGHDILATAGIVKDAAGNSWAGVAALDWSFTVSGEELPHFAVLF
jgi:hypothetical protein